ncbi:MAG: LCP family protein [Acidimicrobiales bacterium]
MTAPTSTEGPPTVAPDAAPGDAAAPVSGPADGPAEGVFLELPDVGAPIEPPAPRRRRLWRWGFPVALLALFAAIPALVYAGYHVVLDSHDGRLIMATTDPAKPGWEGAVEPTPTAAIGTVNESGELTSINILSLTADGAGTVIFVPGDTRAPSQVGGQTLVTAYRAGGVDALKPAIESLMGAGLDELEIADAARWEELVGPVGSLTVANPDNVVFGGQTTFPKGSIDIPPAQIGAYLRTRNWSENDTNRLLRQEAFWRAWLAKVGTADSATAVPGETDSGIGRFVRTLAADQVDYQVLPVKVEPLPDAFASVFVPMTDEAKAIMIKAIPFPTAAPEGSRPKIRVLDGTGQLDHGVGAAQILAAAGAQIDAIGNAASFKIPTTQFIISGSASQDQADQLQAALGVGEVVQSADTSDSVDITVILGADALTVPALQGTVTTVSGG